MDVISVPGRIVRDPVTRRVVDQTPVSIDPTDPSWSRFLADGDVIEAPEHPAIAADVIEEPQPAPAEAAPLIADHASAQDEPAAAAPAPASEPAAETPAAPIIPSAADINVAAPPRATSSQGA